MSSRDKEEEQHKPCKHRKRETCDGVTMDWCYAIGCWEVGDIPCEYCNEREYEVKADNNMGAFKYKLRTIAEALRKEAAKLRDGGLTSANIRMGAASMLYHADKIDEATAEMDKLLEEKGK